MAEATINGIRRCYEGHGAGDPILCIHGGGSSAIMWEQVFGQLARNGRVIAYDRRGCTRSERPDPYEHTTVREQADDAAALLDDRAAAPAIVIIAATAVRLRSNWRSGTRTMCARWSHWRAMLLACRVPACAGLLKCVIASATWRSALGATPSTRP